MKQRAPELFGGTPITVLLFQEPTIFSSTFADCKGVERILPDPMNENGSAGYDSCKVADPCVLLIKRGKLISGLSSHHEKECGNNHIR